MSEEARACRQHSSVGIVVGVIAELRSPLSILTSDRISLQSQMLELSIIQVQHCQCNHRHAPACLQNMSTSF